MQLINYQTNVPEENIATDEYMLLKAERGQMGETLRFWETKDHFVVVGKTGKVREECHVLKCREDQVKIIRRISGGGTVLQGPGCLNYSLILSVDIGNGMSSVNSSYRFILGSIIDTFKKKGLDAGYVPVSDMAIGDKKFSGNAQARKKKFFLHHGTFLYRFDLEKITEYIKYPPKEPEYRQGRGHSHFVTNISFSRTEIEDVIISSFGNISREYSPDERDKRGIECLINEKYRKDSWNLLF